MPYMDDLEPAAEEEDAVRLTKSPAPVRVFWEFIESSRRRAGVGGRHRALAINALRSPCQFRCGGRDCPGVDYQISPRGGPSDFSDG